MGKKLKSLRSKIEELREDLAELWKAVHGKPKPEKVGKAKKGKKAAKGGKPKKGKKAASHKAAGKGPGSAKKGAGAVKKSGPAPASAVIKKPVRPIPTTPMMVSGHPSAPSAIPQGDDE